MTSSAGLIVSVSTGYGQGVLNAIRTGFVVASTHAPANPGNTASNYSGKAYILHRLKADGYIKR